MSKKLKYFLLVILAIVIFSAGITPINKVYAAPEVSGQWSEVQEWPVKAVHAHLLPNGKVMVWSSFENGDNPKIWDPATNSFTDAAKAGFNIFCSGHTLMADGKLFVAGGHIDNSLGLPTASIYDWQTNTWTRVPDMNDGRWYPTTTSLASGNILTHSGNTVSGTRNKIPQVYNINNNKWRSLTAASRESMLYPFMYQAPNGKVFIAGPGQASRYLATGNTGDWGTTFKSNFGKRGSGTSVMHAPGKILITGGGSLSDGRPTKKAETINLNASTPEWKYTSPMNFARRHANSTLLPNGHVLVTGGTSGIRDDANSAVYPAEEWLPGSGSWSQLAANKIYRGYHSVALLLPDARVLVAGGEASGQNAEIFSPPYLFKRERPSITSSPTQVDYGQRFFVGTPNASEIKNVRLIRLGSVTHSFDQSQIINKLDFIARPNGISVTATESPKDATPGYYMLFILNERGVPSVAKIIKLGNITVDLSTVESPTTTFQSTVGLSAENHEAQEQEEL